MREQRLPGNKSRSQCDQQLHDDLWRILLEPWQQTPVSQRVNNIKGLSDEADSVRLTGGGDAGQHLGEHCKDHAPDVIVDLIAVRLEIVVKGTHEESDGDERHKTVHEEAYREHG